MKRSISELRLGNKLHGLLSNMLFTCGATRDSWPQWVSRTEILVGPYGNALEAGTDSHPEMVSYTKVAGWESGATWAGLDTCVP